MDTKLKSNNQNNVFGFILSFILIAFITIGVIASYPIIWKNTQLLLKSDEMKLNTKITQENEYYKSNFIRALNKSNYVLYWNSKQQLVDSNINPSQVFLSKDLQELSNKDEHTDEKQYFVNNFNNMLESWYNHFYSQTLTEYSSLQYYFLDHKTGNSQTNTIELLNLLTESSEEERALKASFPFYIVFQFMEDGSMQIVDYSGLGKENIDEFKLIELNKSEMQNDISTDEMYWHMYKDRVKSPSDATIIYASKSKDFYVSDYINYNRMNPQYIFSEAGLNYTFIIAILLVFLLAMLLPCNKSLQMGNGFISKIPFEISGTGILIVFASYGMLLPMAWETVSGYYISDPDLTVLPDVILTILDYGINFLVWMVVLCILFLCLLSIRQVFTLGLLVYVKKKTIVGRTIIWFKRKIKRFFTTLGEIDLSDPSNKAIIKILAVNFVILLLLCSIWFFGIAILILYTIILFFIIRKYGDDIKRKYAILLEATSRIADGNLEETIEEDLGVFEPLKNELTKVQLGFKKAVEEEIKSQRMKTDLITNVSHDLKTPLTAIITYINLLKEDNVSEEERKSYIETLDNKSQRLKRLFEDLFEISKVSSNNITLNLIEINLVDLIRQVLLELDDKISGSLVEFRFNPPEEKIILSLDSEKTYRIFENLIINITKYAMPNTRAYIDITRKENAVNIILKNVSALELDFNTVDISERFVRGDQARNTEGSGLGLAIVKSFVELQNGKFKIEIDGDLFKVSIEWKEPYSS